VLPRRSMTTSMEPRVYKFTPAVRRSLIVIGVLLCLLVVTIPFGVWIIWRATHATLTVGPREVVARSFTTAHIDLGDVRRFATLHIGLGTRGAVGGALGRGASGGGTAMHLCFKDSAGKTRRFMVSRFERSDEITAEITRLLGKQPEVMSMGAMGPRWPGDR
jgi:hypothetical protein